MPKIEFLLRRVECRVAAAVFVSSNQTLLSRFKTRVTESIFIHFSFRFIELGFIRWICICTCLYIKIFTSDEPL